MNAAIQRAVILKNTDENGKLLADPWTEKMPATSMHHVIPALAKLIGVLAALACALP